MSDWHSLHFNKIAKVLRDHRYKGPIVADRVVAMEQLLDSITLEFAEYFRDQNPSFDANNFIEACGFKKEVK